MRKIIFIVISLVLTITANTQLKSQQRSQTAQNQKVMSESESISPEDVENTPLVDEAVLKNEFKQLNTASAQMFKITEPVVLSVYKPDKAIDKHIGVIVCPGGGYRMHLLPDVIHLSTFLIKQGFTPYDS